MILADNYKICVTVGDSINIGVDIPAANPPVEGLVMFGGKTFSCNTSTEYRSTCWSEVTFAEPAEYNYTLTLRHIAYGEYKTELTANVLGVYCHIYFVGQVCVSFIGVTIVKQYS